MDPPTTESGYTPYYSAKMEPLLRTTPPDLEDGQYETVEIPPLSNTLVLLSSSIHLSLKEKRSLRSQWSLGKYLCWMIPICWNTFMYLLQFSYGLATLAYPELQSLALYNIVAGTVGLSLVSIQIIDNWFYIKPSSWIKEEELEEVPKTYLRFWSIFFTVFILDAFLFVWTILGSIWTFQLYGSGTLYEKVIIVFAFGNMIYQFSKYGVIMFSVKIIISYNLFHLLKFV